MALRKVAELVGALHEADLVGALRSWHDAEREGQHRLLALLEELPVVDVGRVLDERLAAVAAQVELGQRVLLEEGLRQEHLVGVAARSGRLHVG